MLEVKNNPTILIALMLVMVSFFAAQELLTGRVTHECVDSDGLDYFTKGFISLEGEKLEDSCADQAVLEYYCSKNLAQVKVYSCPEGCENGACKQEAKPAAKQAIKIGTVHDQLEIGEYIGDVIDTLTARDTEKLSSGTIATKEGLTTFNQYLRFKDTDLLSGRVLFTEDDNNDVQDFLVFDEKNYTFEYEVEFSQGLASDVTNKKLEDLIKEKITILGRTYIIVDATKSNNRVTLTLLSGAIDDELQEGETRTYLIDGKEYSIKALSIDDQARTAILSVNGKITASRGVGEIELLDKNIIGITKIIISEAAEQPDRLTFVLGAEKLEFTDGDYTDDSFTQGVSINGKSLSNAYVKIKGTTSDDTLKISSIKYRIKAESEKGSKIYIPSGKSLRNKMRYPQMLLAEWDLNYQGLTSAGKTSIIKFDPHSNAYDLEVTNTKGQRYDISLVINTNNNLKIGTADNTLHFIEGTSTTNYIISQNDYMILTTDNDRTGITNIVRYSSIDTTGKILSFDELAEGKKEITYTGTEGTNALGSLVISGSTYNVYIGGAPDYKLAIDLNHDGDVNSDEVNIVTEGGGLLDLGSTTTPNDDFNMTLTTQAKQFDTRSSDETITISIIKSDSSIDLNLPTQTALTIESKTGKKLAMSTYGVFLKQELDNPDELTIQYPLQQAIANIELIFRETPKTVQTIQQKEEPAQTGPQRQSPEQQPTTREEAPTKEIVKSYETKETGLRSWFTAFWKLVKNIFM
ncbi:hypothetical protein HYS50_02870 [Candidatus Woesearchaeota archaeon]|nr:hypothetical protein [Candidatus Woesearchaeota archaeon]